MAKLAQTTSKYTIIANFEAEGSVEKPDVIGAIFGQTEGLLGPEMDLRELQRTGRIGRIDVSIKMRAGKASGKIIIPSSMDAAETALIAATVETIDRIGPCNARVTIDRLEDVRAEKRRYVIERAKQLLSQLFEVSALEATEVTEQIKEAVRAAEVVDYQGLPAGPDVQIADSIIIVEGRADVINLLKAGIKNVIAIEGTSIPKPIIELSHQKETTAFLDGDRGGDLILKELLSTADIDYVARAPRGKEVEELTKKEIFKALRERIPATEQPEIKPEKPFEKPKTKLEPEQTELFRNMLNDLTGTRAALLFDDSWTAQGRVPLRELFNAIKEVLPYAIVLDGEANQRLVNFAASKGVKWIVATRAQPRLRIPKSLTLVTYADLSKT